MSRSGKKTKIKDFVVPTTLCLKCGATLDRASPLRGKSPIPGDVSLCIKCANVAVFGDDLRLRHPTGAELERLAMNRDLTRMRRIMLERAIERAVKPRTH